MNPVVVIPTIFGLQKRRGLPSKNPVEVYDHPTAPGNAMELRRCLASLEQVADMPPIILLVSAQQAVRLPALDTIAQVVSEFPTLDILVVGESEAQLIRQRLAQLGARDLDDKVGLVGYAAMRNLGLVIANVLRYDAVIFLEDDEVIDTPDFIERAVYGLGKLTRRGVPILAKTGFYYNAEGTYLSMSQDKWYNHYWQQGKAFDAWITRAMAGARLSRSNHVCGGCLVLHREAFRRLSFDPWIPRGEDLDYMLDLRMYGSDIWFDNQWSLVHLPPKSADEGVRFRQDIYRWLYEFRKVEYSRTQIDLLQVTAASLEPYPGPFLRPGITRRVKRTAFLRSLARPNKSGYRKAARAATRGATVYAEENCSRYFEFQHIWPELMRRAEGDRMLSHALMQRMRRSVRPTVLEALVEQVPTEPLPQDAPFEGIIELEPWDSAGSAPEAASLSPWATGEISPRATGAMRRVEGSAAAAAAAAGSGVAPVTPAGVPTWDDADAADVPPMPAFDPGLTSEIRLNIQEDE